MKLNIKIHGLACASLALSLAASCGSTGTESADWTYDGDTGPDHWGDLKTEYILANTGRRQSPIDISTSKAVAKTLSPIEVDYHETTLEVFNNGHTVEDNYHNGGTMTVDGHAYKLAQFHFHSPSEHTINGKHSAIEMHLVHKDADGNLAVIGVMINEGARNEEYAHLGKYAPTEPGRAEPVEGVNVNATNLLPDSLASYRYSGSLTTPPCSEEVSWFILQNPIELSKTQIEDFRTIYFGNNRPTQPLNGRPVIASK